MVNGNLYFLPAPGIVGSEAALNVLLEDMFVQKEMVLFDRFSLELVRIGAIELLRLLNLSGYAFNNRLISMNLEQLRQIEQACGACIYAAIHGALCGNWINILITDQMTTENLID